MCPEKWSGFGLGGPRLPGGQRWRESKRLLGWAMEPCGGTRARSVGTVYANEWAGFFEKSCSGTGSAPVAPGTGDDVMTRERTSHPGTDVSARWWCHARAGTWRHALILNDVMKYSPAWCHVSGRNVFFFETIFLTNHFTIFIIFKDSSFSRKFWIYIFNNPTGVLIIRTPLKSRIIKAEGNFG